MSSGRGLFGFPKVSPEEKQRALQDPGPSWREWLSGSFAKTYLGLGFFIADAIIVAYWLGPPIVLTGLVVSIVIAIYLEYLCWQFLWYVPRAWTEEPPVPASGDPWSSRGEAEARASLRRLWHPVRFGRWTNASTRWRSGHAPVPTQGPDPREFL